jgi:hypothetical protein
MKSITIVSVSFPAMCVSPIAYSASTLTGDVNANGVVGIVDAFLIAEYCTGIVKSLCDDSAASFVRAKEAGLVVGDREIPIHLRGVAFGNEVWTHDTIRTLDHGEIDFQRVKDMEMNTIRFYINYRHFEDDATPYAYYQTGWDWLDRNVSRVGKYGPFIILNIHIPQGGFQSDGDGAALWDVPENRNRLTALWTEIARRYAKEPAVGGYDPLNEPIVDVE